jgi:hypothetical protein
MTTERLTVSDEQRIAALLSQAALSPNKMEELARFVPRMWAELKALRAPVGGDMETRAREVVLRNNAIELIIANVAKELTRIRDAETEECAKVLDVEAQKWAAGKERLIPMTGDDTPAIIAEGHDRYSNYIHNAERLATAIRARIGKEG